MSKIWGMLKRHKGKLALLICIFGIIGWYNYEFPSATWRYKMTVTVETPEGIKTGSAVREVSFENGASILPGVAGSSNSVKGEAVVVEIGQGKYLFALMDVDGSYGIVYDVFPYSSETVHDYIKYYKSITGQKAILKPNQYPTMVTFMDIKDPKTVTTIDVNNLTEIFGTGVKLKDVTIEMTDEPVTWGIDNYQSWLADLKGGYLDGQFAGGGSELSNILYGGNFKVGELK